MAQEPWDVNPDVVSEWSSGEYFEGNQICVEDCNRTCVQKCPVAELCNEDEIKCGKKDLPIGVWPDCIRDDICVPDKCECKQIIYDPNIQICKLEMSNELKFYKMIKKQITLFLRSNTWKRWLFMSLVVYYRMQ